MTRHEQFDDSSTDFTKWTFQKLVRRATLALVEAFVFGGASEMERQLHAFVGEFFAWRKRQDEWEAGKKKQNRRVRDRSVKTRWNREWRRVR